MVLSKSIGALLHIATFAILASAADKLAFKSPKVSDLKKAASGYPYIKLGSEVEISWSTDFDETTLAVYQQVNGNVFVELIADSNGPGNTSATWTAMGINGHPLRGALFHFYLQNSANFNCDGCYLNTQEFQLTLGLDETSSSESPSTPTGSAATNTATSSASAGPGAAGADSGNSQSQGDDSNDLAIPLGVGLGAGGFALFAFIGIFFMYLQRRKKQKRDSTAKAGTYDESSSGSTQNMKQNDNRFSRESGALGPYMANPSPNWEQQEAQQREQQAMWQRQQQEEWDQNHWPPPPRHPGRLSQNYIPFQPVMETHSEQSAESSRHSWIDQFDFERPGYRDEDEISELRRSIHLVPGDGPDAYPPSAYSRASIGDVSEIPQVPQPVHHSYPEGNWPLRS